MVSIIADNHAHRLLSNGLMESASVEDKKDGSSVKILQDWQVQTPEVLGITGAEHEEIRRTLNRLATVFYTGRKTPPRSVIKNAVAEAQATVR